MPELRCTPFLTYFSQYNIRAEINFSKLQMIGYALSTNFGTLLSHLPSLSCGRVLASGARGLGFNFRHNWGNLKKNLIGKKSSVLNILFVVS